MRHELKWVGGQGYCICGWSAEPSNVPYDEIKKDQERQFLDHLRTFNRERTKQLDDHN